jgi:O-antigen/teichoic acid export membrane protein
MTPGLRGKAIRSSAINSVLSMLLKALLFGQVVLFTRLFTPDEYGQLTTVLLIISFATLLGRMGLNEAMVRESRNPREVLNTAFALSLWIAAGLAALLVVLSPVLAAVFRRPELAHHLRFLAVMVFIIPFELPTMLWVRELQFGRSKYASFADVLVSTVVTVVLHLGFHLGVLSLLVGRLSGFVVGQGFAWAMLPYRPHPTLHREHAISLYHFGWPLAISALCNFAIYQMDDVFVRLFWGDQNLAYYTLAFALPYYLKEFTDLMVSSLLPIYSKLSDAHERARTAFVEVNRYLGIAMAPLGLALFFFAEPLTILIFGEKWRPTIPVLRVFAWGFTIETLGGYSWGMLVVARGKTKLSLIAKSANAAFLLTIGAFLIWKFGIMGGAWAMLGHAVMSVLIIRPLILYRELGNLYYLRDSWKPLVAAVVAGYISVFITRWLPAGAPALLVSMTSYIVLYAGLYVLIDRPILQDTRAIASVLAHRPSD